MKYIYNLYIPNTEANNSNYNKAVKKNKLICVCLIYRDFFYINIDEIAGSAVILSKVI